jgi:hypothetical protein
LLVLALVFAVAVFVRGGAQGEKSAPPASGCTGSQTSTAVPTAAPRPPIAKQLMSLRLVSYYPADAAWTNMWTNWQPDRIDRDLCGIAALGANAVRIIVQPGVFGFPRPAAAMLDRLSSVVGIAAAHGLRVQLTLFDWWSDYSDLPGSDAWAKAVLQRFRGDFRIAFCELKNEINVDDVNAMSWARHEIPVIRAALGSVPVTVSVSGDSPAMALAGLKAGLGSRQPDFYDVHYYGEPGAAFAQLSAARAEVAPAALFVGETGESSQAADSPAGDAQQDLYLRAVEWAAMRAGLPLAAPWMYTDLVPAAVPAAAATDAAGGIAADQLYFGLIRADGAAKPAAQSMRRIFSGQTVPLGFNNGFSVGHAGLPDGWQSTAAEAPPGTGMFAWDPSVGHYAPGSARLSRTSAAANPVPAFYTTPVTQPTHAGEKFRLTAWAKGIRTTGSNRVAISWFADDGTFLGENDSSSLQPGIVTWTTLSVTADTPPGAAYAQVRLQSEGNTGTVWFDDVSFTAVN